MRRGLRVVVVLVVVSAAAGLGWVAGQRVKSPDQVAFEAEPPAPSLITVEVQLTELAADVIVRADVGYDDPVSLKLSGALGGLPEVLVVTAAPERGTEISEGSVAIEISGRPVFLLEGEIPVFRDLRPKAVGPDVLQLEEALARLGYFDGEPDEEWDLATGAAVAAWYESRGYEPNGVSADEQHRLDQADDRVDSAEEMVEAAQDRLEAAHDQVKTAEKGGGYRQGGSGHRRGGGGYRRGGGWIPPTRESRPPSKRSKPPSGEGDQPRAPCPGRGERLEEAQAVLVEAEQGPDELEIRRARSEVLSAEEQVGFAEADAESGSEEGRPGDPGGRGGEGVGGRQGVFAGREQVAERPDGRPSRRWDGADRRPDGGPPAGRPECRTGAGSRRAGDRAGPRRT